MAHPGEKISHSYNASINEYLCSLHNIHSYWFFRLYRSLNSISSLNLLSLGSFNSPAFISLRPRLRKCTSNFSSGAYLDGFRWLVSMKLTTSLYLVIHRSSCVIVSRLCSLWFSVGFSIIPSTASPLPPSSSASALSTLSADTSPYYNGSRYHL